MPMGNWNTYLILANKRFSRILFPDGLSSCESPVPQWLSIRTSNRKILGSTPDRSTQISFFRVCLCHSLNNVSVLFPNTLKIS